MLLKRQYFDVSSMRSDCTSLSSLMGFCFGRIVVFSIVFAISARRNREKVVALVEHKLGEVPLVTTVTSTISTFGSGHCCLSSHGSLDSVCCSFTGELPSEDEIFAGSSSFSSFSVVFRRYLPATSFPFKYGTAGLVDLDVGRLKLFTWSLFDERGYSLLYDDDT